MTHSSSIHPSEFSRFIALCLTFILIFGALYLWLPNTLLRPAGIAADYAFWEATLLKVAAAWLLITVFASGLQYRSTYLSLLNGVLLGLSCFVLMFGLTLLDPSQTAWLSNVNWQLPTGIAVLLKPVTATLPTDYQLLGIWLLISVVMQAVFAVFLLRIWTQDLTLQNLGALLFVTAPVLLNSSDDLAFVSHWYILAGLWLYFRPLSTTNWFPSLWGWLMLVALGMVTHPYWAILLLAMASAFYLRFWLIKHRGNLFALIASLIQLVILIAAATAVGWLVGSVSLEQTKTVADASHYSVNLQALFNPLGWSLWLKDIPLADPEQAQGFYYLGFGLLLLSALAIYLGFKQFPDGSNWAITFPLLIMTVVVSLIAFTAQITSASREVLALNYQWLTEAGTALYAQLLNIGVEQAWLDTALSHLAAFYPAGYLFWIVYYLVIFLVLGLIVRRSGNALAILVLLVGLSIQLFDINAKQREYWAQWHGVTTQTAETMGVTKPE